MTAHVLGRAVRDVINAVVQGTLINGRAKGAVDQGADFVALSYFGKAFQIDAAQVWIRRAFRDQEACLFADRGFKLVIVTHRNHRRFNAKPLEEDQAKLAGEGGKGIGQYRKTSAGGD